MEGNVGLIYQKIPAVMADLGAIEKGRENKHFRYNFRGIDDLYNAAHAVLVKHGVFTVPYVVEQTWSTHGSMQHVCAIIEYCFYAADGSMVRARVLGEGADSGDKSANKAMAAAHKYALLQVFAIPTEEAKDSENDSPDLSGEPPRRPQTAPRTASMMASSQLAEAGRHQAGPYVNVSDFHNQQAEAASRHPAVDAAERTFGVEASINDEQYNAILEHFKRLNWPRPHATNYLRKHYGVAGPKELSNKKAAECLLDLEARKPDAKEAK